MIRNSTKENPIPRSYPMSQLDGALNQGAPSAQKIPKGARFTFDASVHRLKNGRKINAYEPFARTPLPYQLNGMLQPRRVHQ